MPRRALPLLLSPLLAACPTYAYGPEAFELDVEPEACEAVELELDCSRFAFDNGVVQADPEPQVVVLRMAFESDHHNLAYLELEYSVPGMPLERRTCSLPTGAIEDDEDEDEEAAEEVDEKGFGCVAVGLADVPATADIDVTRTRAGILQIDASLPAVEAGSYAISAWLHDENGFDSPKVRWQFVVEPGA